jgi:hypothetical protein
LPQNLNQVDRFAELARQIECDEDEARWDEKLKRVAQHTPAPEPEKPE